MVLSLQHVQKSFSQARNTLHILNDATLTVERGETVALIGPSGSGKTTLLQIAGLLDTPTSGKVIIEGQECSTLSDQKRTAIRRNSLGFVYQFHHLLPEFSALENVMMPLMIGGTGKIQARDRALVMLDQLGLSARAEHRPAELSGGEQQRVAIARALVHQPALLLADEPTGNLDPTTSETVFDLLLANVKKQGLAAFVVTHNPQLAAEMDRVFTLKDGVLIPYLSMASA